VRWGHQVTVVTSAPNFPQGKLFPGYRNRWHQRERVDGIEVVRVKTFIAPNAGIARRTLDFLSFGATSYLAGLVESRPDIVVATSPQFFTAVAGWAVAASRRLPFVFELGDLWPRSILALGILRGGAIMALIERLELFLYRHAAMVIALTEAFKADLIARGIPAAKIRVVRNGADLPRYAPRPREEKLASAWSLAGKFVVGYLGTHGLAHDLGRVLEAAALLRDDPATRFLLVGAGAERDRLVAEATRRGLENVILQPMQPKEAVPGVWSLCDVALVHLKDAPAFAEVIPSKMFEAMAMGLPILLAAPDGEARCILEGSGAGLWVPAGDPAALAAAVRRLAADAALRQRLAAASLAAAPRHSREQQARSVLDALSEIVG
jgi:glycosyltransferase involved in cell wall biosynthesis